MASVGRSRRCALCQQFYGSGFLDNVPAGELLRARRMLMERSTEDDGEMSRLIREGFDRFLADLTSEREALDISQRTMPLDICVFCVQFLPSSYVVSVDTEDEQYTQTFTNYVRATPPSSRMTPRCNSGGQMRSSLVIQHQFPSKTMTPAVRGKSPQTTARTYRPRPPRSSPIFRLLSKDTTRVLRIESPVVTLNSMPMGNEYDQHRGLMAATDDIMGNLQMQEKHQTTAILRAESSKREAYYRQRVSTAKLAQQNAREHDECLTGSVNQGSPHQNIIDVLIRGAGTLYTGANVTQRESNLPPQAPRTSVTAKSSKIVTKKHDRHFKTELFFPAIPINNRAVKK